MISHLAANRVGRVNVVDDDHDFSQSVAFSLANVGYEVECFPSAGDFLDRSIAEGPAVAVVDILMPGVTGIGLCQEIVTRGLPCSFLVVSGHADVPSAVEAMRLGAIDLLEKPFSQQRLLESVNRAAEVARVTFERNLVHTELLRRLQTLSPREREVLNAVAEGLVSKEIAKRLDISVRTVDVHRSRLMQKLQIESPSQLASYLAVVDHLQRAG